MLWNVGQLYQFDWFPARLVRQINTHDPRTCWEIKQLSREPEKFRWLNGIRTHDLCDAVAVL